MKKVFESDFIPYRMGEKFGGICGGVGVATKVGVSAGEVAVKEAWSTYGVNVAVFMISTVNTGLCEQEAMLNDKTKTIKDRIARLMLSLLDDRYGDNTPSPHSLFHKTCPPDIGRACALR
jgi:hypothetical protein